MCQELTYWNRYTLCSGKVKIAAGHIEREFKSYSDNLTNDSQYLQITNHPFAFIFLAGTPYQVPWSWNEYTEGTALFLWIPLIYSSNVLKTSVFSWVRSTSETMNVPITQDEEMYTEKEFLCIRHMAETAWIELFILPRSESE